MHFQLGLSNAFVTTNYDIKTFLTTIITSMMISLTYHFLRENFLAGGFYCFQVYVIPRLFRNILAIKNIFEWKTF